MQVMPMVVLRHITQLGTHYDWMIADPDVRTQPTSGGMVRPAPTGDAAVLWTLRLQQPPSHWGVPSVLQAETIFHHRQRYLTFQGPLTAGRGHVLRVARGTFAITRWTPYLRAGLCSFSAGLARPTPVHITLEQIHPYRWRARIEPALHAGAISLQI